MGMPQDVLNCCKLGPAYSSHLPLLSSKHQQCCCSSEWKFLELLEGVFWVDSHEAHPCFAPCFLQCCCVESRGVMPQTLSDFECSPVALRSFKGLLPGCVGYRSPETALIQHGRTESIGELWALPCPLSLVALDRAVTRLSCSCSPGLSCSPGVSLVKVSSAAKGVLQLVIMPLFSSFHGLNCAERGFAGRLCFCSGNCACVRCFGSTDSLTFPVRQGNSEWSSQNSSLSSSCSVLIAWQTKYSSCFGSSLFI